MTNKIGYGKPPKHSQFQKGQSGNPRGRPTASFDLAAALDKQLREKVTVVQEGVRKRIPAGEGVLKRWVQAALKGDVRASDTLLRLAERLQAKEPHTGKDGWWAPDSGFKFTINLGEERYDDDGEIHRGYKAPVKTEDKDDE